MSAQHPITRMMTALLGSANSMVLHRAVIRCFQDAGAANPLEAAAIWEHLVFLQGKQGEWVILPLAEVRDVLFIPERTFQRLTAWLEKASFLDKRRKISIYNGETANYTQYRPDLNALSEALGCGAFEHADLARSKPERLARSLSISREKKERVRNAHFDALREGLYPGREMVADEARIGAVSTQLKNAGWTPELILHVLSEVFQKESWWRKNGVTPDAFLKHAEKWRSKYERNLSTPPVVTPGTTPDDGIAALIARRAK